MIKFNELMLNEELILNMDLAISFFDNMEDRRLTADMIKSIMNNNFIGALEAFKDLSELSDGHIELMSYCIEGIRADIIRKKFNPKA